MPPLRFRAWHKEHKEWVYFMPDQRDPGQEYSVTPTWHTEEKWQKRLELVPQTGVVVMQSTGLKDKNGKEIFEGDLVGTRNGTGGTWIWAIEWDHRGAWVYVNRGWYRFADGTFDRGVNWSGPSRVAFPFQNGTESDEVFGNVYQHPEFLNSSPS